MTSDEPTLPKHVAIIMDGNGRWAEARQLPRLSGHEAGINALEKVIEAAIARHIPILTVFAFGIENWKRPPVEVDFLIQLFIRNLEVQMPRFQENNIKLRLIGDRTRLDEALQQKIQDAEQATANNDALQLVIAFNYSGRWDIVQATRQLASRVAKGELSADAITDQHFQAALSLSDLPEPDLFIRTSGERRISNFLLWQLAYTELYFTDVLWPDFDATTFEHALQDFASRQRRFGLTGQQVKEVAETVALALKTAEKPGGPDLFESD